MNGTRGYIIATDICFRCGTAFTFNPDRVPVLTGDDGVQRIPCKACIPYINVLRKQAGTEPIVPLRGAYDDEEIT